MLFEKTLILTTGAVQSAAQSEITDIFQLIQQDPLKVAMVFLLWGVSFLFIFYVVIGKTNIPPIMISITFILIAAVAFFLTIYISPGIYQLGSDHPLQFVGAVVASALFGIIVIPIIIMALIGMAIGRMKTG